MARRARRGVVLLVAVGVLVIFTLSAVMFVLHARQHKSTSQAAQKVERYDENKDELLDRALMQLLRGSNNSYSVAATGSLLEDMYGNDGFLFSQDTDTNARIVAVNPRPNPASMQLVEFSVLHAQLNRANGFYAGCVLTMIDGPARMQSTRILGYDYNASTGAGRFQILPFKNRQLPTVTVPPRPPEQFVINGRAFDGRGWGLAQLRQDGLRASVPGGADEDYDIPDYNNPALAGRFLNIGSDGVPGTNDDRWEVLIPSFHRPALIHAYSPGVKDARYILRPLDTQHPNFDGGNPALTQSVALVDGNVDNIPDRKTWDVDNDGDGIPDSIWVDLGMPVQTASDGRQYKPLFAVMVLDMDGRLNLNVHGTINHGRRPGETYIQREAQRLSAMFNLDTTQQSHIARVPSLGQGYSPAEVDLSRLFPTRYRNLLWGDTSRDAEGRYGEFRFLNTPRPGVSSVADPDTSLRNHLYAHYHASFGTRPDMDGDDRAGADASGLPIRLQESLLSDTTYRERWENRDAPIEFNPYQARHVRRADNNRTYAADQPFTFAEQEALERFHDIDAQTLPNRLARLLDPDIRSDFVRGLITTRSGDVPSPGGRYILEWLGRRIINRGNLDVLNNTADLRLLNDSLYALVAPESANGLRLNLNRPFGNGRDDNGNRVPDEDSEPDGNEPLWDLREELIDLSGRAGARTDLPAERARFGQFDPTNAPTTGTTPIRDYNRNGVLESAAVERLARQRLARQLFVLAMHVTGADAQTNRAGVHALAQWAVNVVDFRDRDSVMTPFEFDYEPFRDNDATSASPIRGTWDVDGMLGPPAQGDNGRPYRGVVWGCERPELVLSETLAFHDNKTENLDVNSMPDDMGMVGVGMDDDWDQNQNRRPQGSLFIELYAPWLGEVAPDLRRTDRNAIDLSQRTPTTNTYPQGNPVWRLAIGTRQLHQEFVDDPTDGTLDAAARSAEITRFVWFTNASGPNKNKAYYIDDNTNANRKVYVEPGRYAVVGPRSDTRVGGSGPVNSETDETLISLRRGSVTVTDFPDAAMNVDSVRYPTVGTDIRFARGIVVDQPAGRRLSISEPPPGSGQSYDVADPKDMPEDQRVITAAAGEKWVTNIPSIWNHGNTRRETHRYVFLQRLANPLLPYNRDTNPYIVLDFMPIDLSAFNGEEFANREDQVGQKVDDPKMHGSRQRSSLNGDQQNAWIWKRHNRRATDNGGNDYFDNGKFLHSLGYLNGFYNNPTVVNNQFFLGATQRPLNRAETANQRDAIRFGLARQIARAMNVAAGNSPRANPPAGLITALENDMNDLYIGLSRRPYTALPWNNRPYANHLELMQVPRTSVWQLMDFFSDRQTGFAHLLNLRSGSIHRLLEYVGVPPRFAGTDEMLHPAGMNALNGVTRHFHYPPFNRVSLYRDPGRVNVNTIFDHGTTWAALLNDGVMTGAGPPPTYTSVYNAFRHWQQKVWRSRTGGASGYVYNPSAPLQLDSTQPTFFPNPFRSFAGRDANPPPLTAPGSPVPLDKTLLRGDPAQSNRPLLAARTFGSNVGSMLGPDPRDPNDVTQPLRHSDGDRNAAYRYQPYSKLGSVLTTRSNVYGIWVTVGFFEVDHRPLLDRRTHPDGYFLGQELGSDTGEVVRHRLFAAFDRTTPVAFRRGEDYNVRNGLLLKKIIE